MPYRSRKKQTAAMKRWREKHPDYMRKYYRDVVKIVSPPKTDRTHRKKELPVCEEVEV